MVDGVWEGKVCFGLQMVVSRRGYLGERLKGEGEFVGPSGRMRETCRLRRVREKEEKDLGWFYFEYEGV